jgi:hypothetical protein
MDGALRWSTPPLMPIEVGLPSVKERAGSTGAARYGSVGR